MSYSNTQAAGKVLFCVRNLSSFFKILDSQKVENWGYAMMQSPLLNMLKASILKTKTENFSVGSSKGNPVVTYLSEII